jgi:hypothetical protein
MRMSKKAIENSPEASAASASSPEAASTTAPK